MEKGCSSHVHRGLPYRVWGSLRDVASNPGLTGVAQTPEPADPEKVRFRAGAHSTLSRVENVSEQAVRVFFHRLWAQRLLLRGGAIVSCGARGCSTFRGNYLRLVPDSRPWTFDERSWRRQRGFTKSVVRSQMQQLIVKLRSSGGCSGQSEAHR